MKSQEQLDEMSVSRYVGYRRGYDGLSYESQFVASDMPYNYQNDYRNGYAAGQVDAAKDQESTDEN